MEIRKNPTEIPGEARVCGFCHYRNRYLEGGRKRSRCLLKAWENTGKGKFVIPITFRKRDVPEGCVYLADD